MTTATIPQYLRDFAEANFKIADEVPWEKVKVHDAFGLSILRVLCHRCSTFDDPQISSSRLAQPIRMMPFEEATIVDLRGHGFRYQTRFPSLHEEYWLVFLGQCPDCLTIYFTDPVPEPE